MVIKFVCYTVGASFFLVLCYLINECIRDATDQRESLLHGSSSIRMLSLIVIFTWIPFPIWYALSPEGWNVITNSPAMKVAVAFLNVISELVRAVPGGLQHHHQLPGDEGRRGVPQRDLQ